MAKLRNYLRTLIRKWLDKMQYKIEHEMDKPVKIDWDKLIMTKEELEKLTKKKKQ